MQPNLLSFCLLPFLVPEPPPTASRDRRLAAAGPSPSTVSKRTCPPPGHRSCVLGVAVQAVVGLTLDAGNRQTGDRNLLASQGISSVLDLEKLVRYAREAGSVSRSSRPHSEDEYGESPLGSSSREFFYATFNDLFIFSLKFMTQVVFSAATWRQYHDA